MGWAKRTTESVLTFSGSHELGGRRERCVGCGVASRGWGIGEEGPGEILGQCRKELIF